jgi:hypothetical protein
MGDKASMLDDFLFETIKELRTELEQLDLVIRQVEALVEGRARRGRPPKSVAEARGGLEAARPRVVTRRGRPGKPASGDNDG